ncbi:MAG: hypothetical protein ACRD82_02365 [Blastocatellia bacterium]
MNISQRLAKLERQQHARASTGIWIARTTGVDVFAVTRPGQTETSRTMTADEVEQLTGTIIVVRRDAKKGGL